MRKYLHIILFIIQIPVFSQVSKDTIPVIYSWTLENYYSQTTSAEVDTNLSGFHVYDPQYKKSFSNSFLGNLGTATISNIFTDRYDEEPFFINTFLPYLYTTKNTRYFNTRKQFTNLTFIFDRLNRPDEESFNVIHTQNLSPKLNITLQYDNISARGQYRLQKVKKNSFRLAGSYSGRKYTFHASGNLNYYMGHENGGIIDSLFESEEYSSASLIPTVFQFAPNSNLQSNNSNAVTKVRYSDFLITQRLRLFTIGARPDTAERKKATTIAEPILSHFMRINKSKKYYTDTDPVTPGLYMNRYFNTHETFDSISSFLVSNMLHLEFKTTIKRKIQTGIYGFIGYDYEINRIFSEWDTIAGPALTPLTNENNDTIKGINLRDNLFNTYVSTGIYGNFWSRISTNFSGRVYIAGYKAGETELKGLLKTNMNILKRKFLFEIEAIIYNKQPGYFQQNYYSNHYYWDRQLNSQNGFHLSSILASPSNKFEIRGYYSVLRNFIFYNSSALPDNSDNIINYFSIEAAKTFRIWKFYSLNKIVYQVSENTNILPLPAFVLYSSTYFDHTFRFKLTNGALQTIFGIDTYYISNFNGYEYSPATNIFYVQTDRSIGNFPLFDLFLSIKLKRTRFFMKLQHFNSSWFEKNYYSAIHYPYNQNDIKFGLSWTFYD